MASTVADDNHNTNNHPSSTDPNRSHASTSNASNPSAEPNAPPVPSKHLAKSKPQAADKSGMGSGNNNSRSGSQSSTPRSDTESPKSDSILVDSDADNDTLDPERSLGIRSRSQSMSGGSLSGKVRMIISEDSTKRLADNTMSHGNTARRAVLQAPEGHGLGAEDSEQGGGEGKHQQHHANVQGGSYGRLEHHQAPDSYEGYSDSPQSGSIVDKFGRYFYPSPQDKEMNRLKSQLNQRSRDLENHQQEIRRLQRELKGQINNVRIFQTDRQKLIEANNSLQYELFNVRKQLEEVKSLADIRGKELLGAQKFLTKADSISVSDVKERVVALNDEIFQAAASLGETITHHFHGLPKEEATKIYGEVMVPLIGEPISVMVAEESQKPNAEANPLLVQVVLQVFMANVCASKIELWVPNDAKVSDFLATVYTNIQATEEPAVSGRWRALTQAHARPVTADWKDDLIFSLIKIFKIAAWKLPDKDQRLSFESKLVPIFKAVEDLRIAIGEEITSADMQLLLVAPDSRFNGDWMDDAFADARVKVPVVSGGPTQRVVGTTGFGLKKVIPGQRGPSGEIMCAGVLAPKVILESTLREALNPPPRQAKSLRKTAQKVSNVGRSANTSVLRNGTNEAGGEIDTK